jgi:hypothetical protein
MKGVEHLPKEELNRILAHANGVPRFPCLRTQEPYIPRIFRSKFSPFQIILIFKKMFAPFSSSFTLISAQKTFHDPRTTPSGRKVRESEEEEEEGRERKSH